MIERLVVAFERIANSLETMAACSMCEDCDFEGEVVVEPAKLPDKPADAIPIEGKKKRAKKEKPAAASQPELEPETIKLPASTPAEPPAPEKTYTREEVSAICRQVCMKFGEVSGRTKIEEIVKTAGDGEHNRLKDVHPEHYARIAATLMEVLNG